MTINFNYSRFASRHAEKKGLVLLAGWTIPGFMQFSIVQCSEFSWKLLQEKHAKIIADVHICYVGLGQC